MKTNEIVKQGFVAITPTLCQGNVMTWATEDEDGKDVPVVCETIEEVQEEIAEDEDSENFAASYIQYWDGSIVVKENDEVVIETSLEEWRANR